MDRDRKTEGGASSEPAFDVSQVCLRVRGLFGLTSELFAAAQIDFLDGLEAPNDVRRSLSYLLSRGEGDCDTTLFQVLGLAFQQEHKLQRCYVAYGYSMVSVSESTMPSAKWKGHISTHKMVMHTHTHTHTHTPQPQDRTTKQGWYD